MLVYEDLDYIDVNMYSTCQYMKFSIQAYRPWTDVQECSHLYFAIYALAYL